MIVLEVQTPQETTSRSVVARRFPLRLVDTVMRSRSI